MKKTPETKSRKVQEMAPNIALTIKRSNRFAKRMKNEPLIVMVDPDFAKVFRTSEEVNKALRALISALPDKSRGKVIIGQYVK